MSSVPKENVAIIVQVRYTYLHSTFKKYRPMLYHTRKLMNCPIAQAPPHLSLGLPQLIIDNRKEFARFD
jgi:hypothetical protein